MLAPPAPSYLQAKQSEATKWSPLWAVMPNPAVESPKTKHSSGKGGHHRSSGHGSNTSTPKHPDSTSAKKPSPKGTGQVSQELWLSQAWPFPLPSTKSARHKWKEAHTEDTHKLNSTLTISSSGFDGFHSPTGSTVRQLSSSLPASP